LFSLIVLRPEERGRARAAGGVRLAVIKAMKCSRWRLRP
jgi:hypothetical protein